MYGHWTIAEYHVMADMKKVYDDLIITFFEGVYGTSMLYWWGLDFSAFDKKGVFSRISLILTAFHRFVLSFHHSPSFLCSRHRFIAFQLKSVRIAQNNGEWWKIGQICEKLSKSKKFVKKTPFFVTRGEILVPTNPTRFNCNFNCDKY